MTRSKLTKSLSLVAVTLSSILLFGCATATKAPDKYEEGHSPELGVRSSASVGEVMVSKYNYSAEEVATLLRESESNIMLGRPSIPANSKLVKATSSQGALYCYPMQGTISPCFMDQDADGNFDSAYNYSNVSTMIASVGDIDPIPYRVSDTVIKDGFKYDLLYQGVDTNTVRIAYREYSDNLARPAFQQDLTYTLNEGDTQVSFRSVKMTIHSADNNQVNYTVNSGFE